MPLTDADLSAALAGATVVVTGGGGLVGSRITARLRAAGARVIAVGKLDAYPATVYTDLFGVHTTNRDTIVGDITDATLMDHVIREADYVIRPRPDGLPAPRPRRGPGPARDVVEGDAGGPGRPR